MLPLSLFFKVSWLQIAVFLTIVAAINVPLLLIFGWQFAISGMAAAIGAIIALALDERETRRNASTGD